MTLYLELYQGKRHRDGVRTLNDVNGRQIVSSERADCDWGFDASREDRRALARVLLYHARVDYESVGSGVADDAFAVAVASCFPTLEFAITGDQIRHWFTRYLIQGRFHVRNHHNRSGE